MSQQRGWLTGGKMRNENRYYAAFDNDGLPTAFYSNEFHGENIPSDVVLITEDQWLELINNAGFRKWGGSKVVAYESPVVSLTPDELRAQMPPLSRRQFWLGANSLGMSKADVMAATDDPIILIEIEETTEFHRTYESVVMLSEVLGITPEQLDDVWMWWTSA